MVIAQLSTPFESTPPARYGGIERIVSLLTEGLHARGHDVTLFATGDSQTSARLSAYFLTPPRPYLTHWELVHASEALKRAREFDIVHNHMEGAIPLLERAGAPALTTLHNPFAYRLPYFTYFRDANYVSVSAFQSKKIAHMPHVWVVHNSIRPEEFPFAEQKEDFLLFAGSFAPHKGADIAIEVARRLGRRLVLVAKLDPTHQVFYETRIAPFVDGDQVRYAGELGEERKELFRSANCLLFPTRGEEPFGLVMIEAMACGTPVVGFDRASVPEIVSDGVTGFVVRDVSEMVAAVERVDQIDPRACREHVARHFNADVMVERYLDVYEQVRASSAANGAAS